MRLRHIIGLVIVGAVLVGAVAGSVFSEVSEMVDYASQP